MFEGSYVALITPMTPDRSIDEPALRKLVQWHIASGTHGLVPVGTTGESPVLSAAEHLRVMALVVEEAAGKIPIIAGCGSNNTDEAITFHRHAHALGADAALHVTGYYNRPSQEGIYQHFKALSTENSLPIIVYNVPSRTIVDISVETMGRLATLTTIVGVKDATGDLTRPTLERRLIPKAFSYLSGNDGTAVAYNVSGGRGCISVTANVAPAQCAAVQNACLEGDFLLARDLQDQLVQLHEALFIEPSPAGIKYACSRLGLCDSTVRLPMVEIAESTKRLIDKQLDALNIKPGFKAPAKAPSSVPAIQQTQSEF